MMEATTNAPAGRLRSASPAGRHSSRLLLTLALLVIAMLVAACGPDEIDTSGARSAEGLVVDVQGTISKVETFELLGSDGERLTFTPEDGALERSGFSPAHLREHLALAERIGVRYEERDGSKIVVAIVDASE